MSTLKERLLIRLQHGVHTPEEITAMKAKIARIDLQGDAVEIQNNHRSHDEIVEAIEKTDLPMVTNTVTTSAE